VTYNMSSSPALPSPSEIFKKNSQALCTGSRAAPIPQNVTASFTSAETLFKKASDDLQSAETIRSFKLATADVYDIDTTEPSKPSKPKTKKSAPKKDGPSDDKVAKTARKPATKKDEGAEVKKPRKPRAKKIEEGLGENGEMKEGPKKSRAKKVDAEANGNGPVKEKAVRKPRAKKADGDFQMKLSKGKVTKGSKSEGASNSNVKSADPSADSLDFGLVEAVKRRTAWTPPPATTTSSTTPAPFDVSGEGLGLLESGERAKGFKDLFGSFGFTNSDANPSERKASDSSGTRKRKLIELVRTNVSEAAAVAATPKPKAPKKKARTITDQATSAYMEEEEEEEPPLPPAPLLQYFSYKTTDGNDGFKVPAKPRSKSPVKGLKPKKGSAQGPILLSPESALKQVGSQDFVFGTSSQLAREESPTFLRDLHEAIQASNQIEDDPFADILDELSPSPALLSRVKALASTKRTLWSAGARDTSGDLLDVEMIDMVDSPAVARMLKAAATQPSVTSLPSHEDEWHDVEEMSKSTAVSSVEPGSPMKIGPVKAAIREELLSSSPRSSTQKPKSPNPSKASKKLDGPQPSQASTEPPESQAPKRPDYDSYFTAQLAREIASYRFKPVKNRDQMITLLEKCWEGKNRVALGDLGTNVVSKSSVKAPSSAKELPAPSQTTSPKRLRGRPRKDSATGTETSPAKSKAKAKVGRPKKTDIVEFLELNSDAPLSQARTPKKSKKRAKKPIDEISDSDTPMTPSPPRRRPSQLGTSPLLLRLLNPVDAEGTDLTPAALQASLFSHITKAVTGLPPSKDPLKPNWQEKILLYDPIILEDLTLWLNTGALEKVGWDGEVLAKEVKKWCESKSICCLWKENLRGGARSRY
jgi:hypothetical protein